MRIMHSPRFILRTSFKTIPPLMNSEISCTVLAMRCRYLELPARPRTLTGIVDYPLFDLFPPPNCGDVV
jgi:hypothetical protein